MTIFRSLTILWVIILIVVLPAPADQGLGVNETVIMESEINIGTSAGDVWISDGFAYVARFGENGVSIIDVTDPLDPQLASVYHTSATSGTWDVKAAGGFAYLTPQNSGYGLVILDVSDPYAPELVTNFSHPDVTSAHNIWLDEERGVAYLASNTSGNVEVVDVSDPYNPIHLGHFESSAGHIHDMMIQGDVLYASFLEGGLYLGSVAASPVPTYLGSVEYSGAFTHNAWPTADGMYVLTTDEYTGAFIRIWDVSNPSNITEVASYQKNPEAIPHNVHVRNRYAFISNYTEGLVVLDISDPENPVEVGHYDTYLEPGGGFNGAWGVYPYDDYVYVSNLPGELFVFTFKPATLTLTEITEVVSPGGELSFRASLEEDTGFNLDVTSMTSVVLPNGNPYSGNPVFGPVNLSLDPLTIISGRIRHNIPLAAPLGTYRYEVRVEDEEGFRLHSETFFFDIIDSK